MTANTGAPALCREADRKAVLALTGVVDVFENQTSWFNNASFLLPLVAAIVAGVAGAVTRRSDVLGFAGFLAVVTLLMVPVVLATWRHTPTSVVVTMSTLISLHNGRPLQTLPWSEVASVRERETQGNRRWEIAAHAGDRILLDGEIERLPKLIEYAREMTGCS